MIHSDGVSSTKPKQQPSCITPASFRYSASADTRVGLLRHAIHSGSGCGPRRIKPIPSSSSPTTTIGDFQGPLEQAASTEKGASALDPPQNSAAGKLSDSVNLCSVFLQPGRPFGRITPRLSRTRSAGRIRVLKFLHTCRKHTLNREIKRRTRVVGAFPDGESALVLVAARLRHMAGTKWGTRRYLNMDKLRAVEVEKESALGVA